MFSIKTELQTERIVRIECSVGVASLISSALSDRIHSMREAGHSEAFIEEVCAIHNAIDGVINKGAL